MAVASGAFAKELYGVVAARHSKDHPLIGMIERGELTNEQLLGFSVQFYQLFAKIFPKPIAALYARCPDDAEIEKHLLENLIDDGTGQVSGSKSHRDLFIDFAAALGLSREALDAAEPLPETTALLNWRDVLFFQRPWIEAMAAQGYALEGTAAERMKRLVRGMRSHYAIAPDAIGYWAVHIEVEDEHGSVGEIAVQKFVQVKPWTYQQVGDRTSLVRDERLLREAIRQRYRDPEDPDHDPSFYEPEPETIRVYQEVLSELDARKAHAEDTPRPPKASAIRDQGV